MVNAAAWYLSGILQQQHRTGYRRIIVTEHGRSGTGVVIVTESTTNCHLIEFPLHPFWFSPLVYGVNNGM